MDAQWTSQALTDTFWVAVRTRDGSMGNRRRSQGIRVTYAFIKAHRSDEFDTYLHPPTYESGQLPFSTPSEHIALLSSSLQAG